MKLRRQTSIEDLPQTLSSFTATILGHTNALNVLGGTEVGSLENKRVTTTAYIDGLVQDFDNSAILANQASLVDLNSADATTSVSLKASTAAAAGTTALDDSNAIINPSLEGVADETAEIASNGTMVVGYKVLAPTLSRPFGTTDQEATYGGALPDELTFVSNTTVSNGDVVYLVQGQETMDGEGNLIPGVLTDYYYSGPTRTFGTTSPLKRDGITFVPATSHMTAEIPSDLVFHSIFGTAPLNSKVFITEKTTVEYTVGDSFVFHSALINNPTDVTMVIPVGSYIVINKLQGATPTLLGWRDSLHSSKSVVFKLNALLNDADSFQDTLLELGQANDDYVDDIADASADETSNKQAAEAAVVIADGNVSTAATDFNTRLAGPEKILTDDAITTAFDAIDLAGDADYIGLATPLTGAQQVTSRATLGLVDSTTDLDDIVKTGLDSYYKDEYTVASGEIRTGHTDVGIARMFSIRVEYANGSYDTVPIASGSASGRFSINPAIPDGTVVTARFASNVDWVEDPVIAQGNT